jgi:hypothetical protein
VDDSACRSDLSPRPGSSSVPGRLCPAITTRELSDSCRVQIYTHCVSVGSHGWVPLNAESPMTANPIDSLARK